ncbi:hypothetical protein OIU34_17890 [Pararhizobium sp. BT-229]|uniref:bifunctional DNA primase/polymerase n=1 Tax=Pararhizobium sp. BT-229 TaxID=2986923 RepID=UPI0021F7EB6B|nr:hypothetical protein [Pararhizobium sp. BT-229]MCV9963750.1 hypothetical protein [Pararhizobium sp. BT-229]
MADIGGRTEIEDLASIFGGEVVEDASSDIQVVEHMYKPTESVFGAVAEKMVAAGWSIFPQEMTGNRRPGTVDGEMIKWSEHHNLANRKPRPDVLKKWAVQCASLNVAVVLGPASGHTFVLDMDVVEEELSQQIQQLAVRILGDTPLKRVGRWPKMAFVYRHAPEDEIPSRTLHFVKTDHPENPEGDDQLVEIISSGKAMTFYGKHHKTGRYFRWIEGPPHVHGPETVPLVTSAQLGDFLDAVDSIRPFSKSASFDLSSVTWEWDENAKVHVPRLRSHGTANDWTENEDGKVSDGREAYLTRLALRIVTANPGMIGNVVGIETLVKTVVETFSETAELTGRWRGQGLVREAKSKVYRFAKRMASGELKPSAPVQNDKGEYVSSASARGFVPPQPRNPDGDSLDFLPPFVDPTQPGFDFKAKHQRRPMRIELLESTAVEIEMRRKEREISRDRTQIAKSVAQGVDLAFTTFWDVVYDRDRCDTRVDIVKAPTGAGKTSRSIAFIAADPRTYENYWARDEHGVLVDMGRAPILVLMPTYTNIEELRHRAQILNLDGSLSDRELMKQAADMNLYKEDELEGRLADLRRDARNAGLTTMIYSGKLKAGCKMAEKVQMAMAAGLGTSSFCHTDEKLNRETKEVETPEKFCPFYHQYEQLPDGTWLECPSIRQRKEIEKCHVVFLPHAFLALQIPEELKNVRAVVADERIHHLFLHTITFDMDVFASPRKPPRLTKKEVEAGVVAHEFQEDRLAAVAEAIYALKTKGDPAEQLLKKADRLGPGGGVTVDRWIDAALRSCGASMAKDNTIDPDISMEDLAEVCARPTGVAVREEYRFWKIVQERYEARKTERVMEELMREAGREYDPKTRVTRGDKDLRIQLYVDEIEDGVFKESIRISWRETPNWVDRPLMLLDASAAPEMIQKIWHGKEVVVHDIPAALNVRIVGIADRTYSNSSVIAKPSASQREKVQSAKLLANVRKAISVISGYYGFSRVVAGGSILARRAVNTNWEGPHNVDWCHYGAMRGLDFAKYHAAAISVGRMELPVRIIDGLVAALTYDDDEPELPFDKHGTGLTETGQPLLIPSENQRIRMRSGHDVYMPVPTFPGRWGRMIQKQYREEELLQFLGRLRPVYREGEAPIWFSLCSVMPEEVIVDDLVNIGDLIRRNDRESAVWDALRRCQGVLDVPVAAKVCDDLFPGVGGVAKQFGWEGLNTKTGEIEKRVAWSIIALKWEDESGASGYSFARGDLAEPEDALRNARIRYELPKIVKAEKVSQSRGQTAARGRTPDSIEDQLGTLPERRQMEERQQVEVAIKLLMSTEDEAIRHLRVKKMERMVPITVPTGVRRNEDDENSDQITSNLLEIEAAASIEALWRSKGYDVDRQVEAAEEAGKDGQALANETVTDERLVSMGNRVDDRAQEFDLYRFDEVDLAIPF